VRKLRTCSPEGRSRYSACAARGSPALGSAGPGTPLRGPSRCQPGGSQDRDRQRGSDGKNLGSTIAHTPGKKISNIVIFTVLGRPPL
jgi:hypothetical protein